MRSLLRRQFADWEIVEAEDGEAGIERLWNEKFDVVLLDLMLPRMSGYDVIRHLSMRDPETLRRTIIITAADEATLSFFNEGDVAAIFRKPLKLEELRTFVEELVTKPR